MKAPLLRPSLASLYAAAVAAGVVASMLLHAAWHDAAVDRFADNARWTLETLGATALLAARWRRAAGNERWTFGCFLAGAASYAAGQVLWDLGVARGTLTFPGTQDAFYLLLPVGIVAGVFPAMTRRTEGKVRRAAWINLTGIVILILTLTLALYLPARGAWDLGVLGVLAAYPALFLAAFGIVALTAVVRHLAPRPWLLLLAGGSGTLAAAWLVWNLGFLRGTVHDGSLLGYLFSLAHLATAVGLSRWREEEAPPGSLYARGLGHLYRLLPLFLVLAAGAGVAYGQHQLSRPVATLVTLGALAVVACAILRQTLLLYEQEEALATERRLQEREGHLRAVFEHGSDLMFAVSVEPGGAFRYTAINPAGARLGGVDVERFIGSTPAEYFSPDRAALFEANYRRCVEAGETIRYEQAMHVPGGTVVFETTLVPVRDETGRIGRIVGVSRNITAHRASLDAMQALNAQLEGRIQERTGELEAAYRELEMFSYSVSHDLRTPLRGINGFCAALIEDHGAALPAEAQGYLDRIHAASKRMGQIIDDLLQLSRVSRGSLAIQEVDLSALAERIAADLRASAPGRDAAFAIAPGLVARCDLRLIQNVLENLLGNAWKYTSRHASARIGFDAAEKDGETVFRVRDDGAGFDMRFVEKLFQNFQRLHDRSEFEGTGVGLAIVARVVRRHGGRVWAEGAVEQGAAFYFTLGRPPETTPS